MTASGSSSCEKLLGVKNSLKLNFVDHVKEVCENAKNTDCK